MPLPPSAQNCQSWNTLGSHWQISQGLLCKHWDRSTHCVSSLDVGALDADLALLLALLPRLLCEGPGAHLLGQDVRPASTQTACAQRASAGAQRLDCEGGGPTMRILSCVCILLIAVLKVLEVSCC